MGNVHYSGSLCMMSACREVLGRRSGPQSLLIDVTVLTSMEQDDLARNRSGCGASGTEVALGGTGREFEYGSFRAIGPGIEGGPFSPDAGHSGEPSGVQCPARPTTHPDPKSVACCGLRLLGIWTFDQPCSRSSEGAGAGIGADQWKMIGLIFGANA